MLSVDVKAGQITVDARNTLNATGTLGSAVVDNGRINADSDTLTLTAGASGRGVIGIDSGSVLNLDAGAAVASISFLTGGQETLNAGPPQQCEQPSYWLRCIGRQYY